MSDISFSREKQEYLAAYIISCVRQAARERKKKRPRVYDLLLLKNKQTIIDS